MRGLAISLFAMLLAACGTAGSGTIVTDERSLEGFDQVEVGQGIAVRVEVGPSHSVAVNYDDNLVDLISTEVRDGTLIVRSTESYRISGGGRFVAVTMPGLAAVRASGGASVTAAGDSESYRLDASGGASFDGSGLAASTVDVDISGGASAVVTASGAVTGEASGGASLRIDGNPGVVDVETSGGASVSP